MADRSIKVVLSANVTGYTAALQRAAKSTSDFATSASGYVRKHEAELDGLGSAATKAGLAVTAATAFAVKSAMDWETAWTGVLKTVDGTPAQLAAIEDGLRGLAKETGFSAVEVAKVAENAGQLGVATENIVSFTDTMLALGVSTNLTADEAATSIAQMANVMGTAGGDIDNLASTLVALGNDGASTEAQIIQMAQRIAGAAKTVGMSEADVLAFANTVASLGIDVEAGGTAVSTVISRMSQATQTGGAKLEAFARTAGMSADQFAASFKAEPTAAIQTFIEGLGRIQAEGGNVYGVLAEIGLSDVRVSQALIGMASAGDLLADSLATGSDAWEKNTALMDEAGKFYGTTSQQAKQAWAEIKDAAIDAGTALLPAVREILDVVSGLANAFGSLPAPVQGGLTTVAAFGGAALLAVAGVTKLATGVAALQMQLAALGATRPGTAAVVGGIGKMAGVATVLAAVALAAQDAYESTADLNASELQEMGDALERFGKTGDASKIITKAFGKDFGGEVKRFDMDLDSLGKALTKFDRLSDDNSVTRLRQWAPWVGKEWGDSYAQVKQIENLDAALTKLSQTNPEAALQAYQRLHDVALEGGASTEQFAAAFSGMSQVVGQAGSSMGQSADASELLAGGLQDLGPAAQASAEQMQAMRDAANQQARSFLTLGDSLNNSKVSLGDWIREMAGQARALEDFTSNAQRAARRGLDEGLIASLREAGPEGAMRMEQLAGASRRELAKASAAFQRGESAVAGYADRFGEIPATKSTSVKLNGAAQAGAQIGALAGQISRLNDKTVTLTVRTVRKGAAAGAAIGMGLATGGAVYGPGTETSDSIPAMLSKGEHVLTAQDVRRMGGHEAVYRMRAHAASGSLPKFRNGGAVSYRGHTLEYWEDRRMSGLELNQKRREIRDLQRDLNEYEKVKRNGKTIRRKRLRGLDERIAKQQLRAAERELADALYANRLNNSRGGTINERIKRRDAAAEKTKRDAEAAKQKREEQAQARQQLFESAANEREQIFNTVKGSLTGGTISGMFDTSNPWVNPINGKSMAAAARDKVVAVKGYAAALGKLKAAKAPQQVMQEIAGMGIYGGKQAADALLADPAALKSLSQSYAQIDQYAGLAGKYVATSVPYATTQVQRVELVNFREGIIELTTTQSRNAVDAALVVR